MLTIKSGGMGGPVQVLSPSGEDLSQTLGLKDVQVYIDASGVHATIGVLAMVDLVVDKVDYQVIDPATGEWRQVVAMEFADGSTHHFEPISDVLREEASDE